MTLGEPGEGEGEGEGCMFTPCVPGTCPMHDCPLLIVLLVSEEVSLDYSDLAGGIFTTNFPLHLPLVCPTTVPAACPTRLWCIWTNTFVGSIYSLMKAAAAGCQSCLI